MLRKFITSLIILLALFSTSLAVQASFSEARFVMDASTFTINGVPQQSTTRPPFIDPAFNRAMVSLNSLAQAISARVEWNDATRTAVIIRDNTVVSVQVDTPLLHGMGIPTIIQDNTFVPVAFVSRAFGADVRWDAAERAVYVTSFTQTTPTAIALTSTANRRVTPIIEDSFLSNREAPFLYTRSSILLPYRRLTAEEMAAWIREYRDNGGASAFEQEVVRLINEIRRENNLSEVEIYESLMMATRFYSQTLANHNLPLGHSQGPYGGSAATIRAFGVRSPGWRNVAGYIWTAQELVDFWMGSTAHRNNILRPSVSIIGVGSHLGGDYGVVHYLSLTNPRGVVGHQGGGASRVRGGGVSAPSSNVQLPSWPTPTFRPPQLAPTHSPSPGPNVSPCPSPGPGTSPSPSPSPSVSPSPSPSPTPGNEPATITFNLNQGHINNNSANVVKTISQDDLPRIILNVATTPIRNQHEFAGWYCVEDSIVLTAANVALIPVTWGDSRTFIAQWTPYPRVIFHLNDNTGFYVESTLPPGLVGSTNVQTFVRTGHTFEGWLDNGTLRTSEFVASINLAAGDVRHFYASWSTVPVTPTASAIFVLYPGNEVTEVVTASPAAIGDTLTSLPTIPTRPGFTFVEWTHNGLVTTEAAIMLMQIPEGESRTFVAVWEAVPVTPTASAIFVLYPGNEITEVVTASPAAIGDTLTSLPTIPTRPGFTFVEWTHNGIAITEAEFLAMQIPEGESRTFVVLWNAVTTPAAISINFNLNNGNINGNSANVSLAATTPGAIGVVINMPSNPVRQNHVFAGWRCVDDLIDRSPADVALLPVVDGDTRTFVAQWTPYPQITFSCGITFNFQTFTATPGAIIGLNNIPDFAPPVNHVFMGWVEVGDASQNIITSDAVANIVTEAGVNLSFFPMWWTSGGIGGAGSAMLVQSAMMVEYNVSPSAPMPEANVPEADEEVVTEEASPDEEVSDEEVSEDEDSNEYEPEDEVADDDVSEEELIDEDTSEDKVVEENITEETKNEDTDSSEIPTEDATSSNEIVSNKEDSSSEPKVDSIVNE